MGVDEGNLEAIDVEMIMVNCPITIPLLRYILVRRLRTFVQMVRTRLPSQAIDLAVRVVGKESDV